MDNDRQYLTLYLEAVLNRSVLTIKSYYTEQFELLMRVQYSAKVGWLLAKGSVYIATVLCTGDSDSLTVFLVIQASLYWN